MDGQVLNISPIVIWVIALSQLLTFGLTIWNLLASGSRANGKRLEEHGQKISAHDLRLSGIEQTIEGGPTKEDMQGIALALEAMKGDTKVIRAEMDGFGALLTRLEAIVARQENHLMDGWGKR